MRNEADHFLTGILSSVCLYERAPVSKLIALKHSNTEMDEYCSRASNIREKHFNKKVIVGPQALQETI